MGVYLRWKGATGSSYTNTYIYRAGSETGTFSEIANQSYSDLNYYDVAGTTANWYKIKFYDNVADKWSDFSDAWQGGTWQGYCTIQDIRDMTNLTEKDITDAGVCFLISQAGQKLNHDMSVYIEEEYMKNIPRSDGVKINEIDGVNTTFYTYFYPIGDFNNTFKVTVSDIKVYQYDTSTSPVTKTELSVASIIPNTGQFDLTTAPAVSPAKKLKVTYRYVPLSVSDPHDLVRQACILLTASLAYRKVNIGKAPMFKMGNVTVRRDMTAHKTYKKEYQDVLLEINDRSMVDIKEAPSIPGVNFSFNIGPVENNLNDQYDADYGIVTTVSRSGVGI